MIRLYEYPLSSASYRVRIALGLAGLEWTSHQIDLAEGAQRSAEHLRRNPQGLVPVLEIDGLLLTQSMAIVEYLDETRGLGLLPHDAAARAHVRSLSMAIAAETQPICNRSVAQFAHQQSDGEITIEGWMQHFITRGLSAFEGMLKGGRYCFGDQLSLADICLIPQLYNADRWSVDLDNMPKIRTIRETLKAIDAFNHAHPDRLRV